MVVREKVLDQLFSLRRQFPLSAIVINIDPGGIKAAIPQSSCTETPLKIFAMLGSLLHWTIFHFSKNCPVVLIVILYSKLQRCLVPNCKNFD